jgi:hypothetical protein
MGACVLVHKVRQERICTVWSVYVYSTVASPWLHYASLGFHSLRITRFPLARSHRGGGVGRQGREGGIEAPGFLLSLPPHRPETGNGVAYLCPADESLIIPSPLSPHHSKSPTPQKSQSLKKQAGKPKSNQ